MIYTADKYRFNRWNEMIFIDGKDVIVFSMSRKHPKFNELKSYLNSLKKTISVFLNPSDFNELGRQNREDFSHPPVVLCYRKGECIGKFDDDGINEFNGMIDYIDRNYI